MQAELCSNTLSARGRTSLFRVTPHSSGPHLTLQGHTLTLTQRVLAAGRRRAQAATGHGVAGHVGAHGEDVGDDGRGAVEREGSG